MKLKFINKELMKKLTAMSIVTTMTLSGIPNISRAAWGSSTTNVPGQHVVDYDTDYGTFTVTKQDGDNYVITNSKNNNKLTFSDKGKFTYSKKVQDGIFPWSTKTVENVSEVAYFDGENIDIKKTDVKDENVKNAIDYVENLIDGTEFKGITYLDTMGEAVLKDATKLQSTLDLYDESYVGLINYLNSNGVNIKEKNRSNNVKLAVKSSPNDASSANVQPMFAPAPALAIPIVAGVSEETITLLVGTIAGIIATGYACVHNNDIQVAVSQIINDAGQIVSDATGAITAGAAAGAAAGTATAIATDIALRDLAAEGWLTLDQCMDKIKKYNKDNDPNNDYFQAVISKNDNFVWINILHPMGMKEAKAVFVISDVVDSVPFLNEFTQALPIPDLTKMNIYTYQASDARRLINDIQDDKGFKKAGPSKGTSNLVNKAENHAFSKSYNAYNPLTDGIDLTKVFVKSTAKPGMYYWHYHILDEKLYTSSNNGGFVENKKHVFFGTPIVVINKDLINAKLNEIKGGLRGDKLDQFTKILKK